MQETIHPILKQLAYFNAIIENKNEHKVAKKLAKITMDKIIIKCCLN